MLYLCVHCVVWLVFLDPQCSINHAEAPAQPEGYYRCEFDHWEPPWSRTFQLAPGGCLGPQPVPGERGMEKGAWCPNTQAIICTHTRPRTNEGCFEDQPKQSFCLKLPSASTCVFFFPLALCLQGWMTCLLSLSLAAAVPGHVSWRALHWEASEGRHGEVQEAAGRDNQHHQEEERGKEAAVLQHVPRQNPQQCRCLRNKTQWHGD